MERIETTDRFKTKRINELIYRLVCDEVLENQVSAYFELLELGLSPEIIENLAQDQECQEVLDGVNDLLLGC